MGTDTSVLAILGGPVSVPETHADLFQWPIVTAEDEEAVLDVLRRGQTSGNDVTKQFEQEFDYAMNLLAANSKAIVDGTGKLRYSFEDVIAAMAAMGWELRRRHLMAARSQRILLLERIEAMLDNPIGIRKSAAMSAIWYPQRLEKLATQIRPCRRN